MCAFVLACVTMTEGIWRHSNLNDMMKMVFARFTQHPVGKLVARARGFSLKFERAWSAWLGCIAEKADPEIVTNLLGSDFNSVLRRPAAAQKLLLSI